MLKELRSLSPTPNKRRWFSDRRMDLILWYDAEETLEGFQLCYDKQAGERALTWTRQEGFLHHRVDDGESSPFSFKETPILLEDGAFDASRVRDEFQRRAREVPDGLRQWVLQRIDAYPASDDVPRSPPRSADRP